MRDPLVLAAVRTGSVWPLVLTSLVATQERAMALEVRGFGLPVKRVRRFVLRLNRLLPARLFVSSPKANLRAQGHCFGCDAVTN